MDFPFLFMDLIQGLSYSNKNIRGETSDLQGDVLLTARGPYCHHGQGKMAAAPPATLPWQNSMPQEGVEESGLFSEAYQALVSARLSKNHSNKPLTRTDLPFEQK